MQVELTLDTSYYPLDYDENFYRECQKAYNVAINKMPSFVARALDVPEPFVSCNRINRHWSQIMVCLLKVYDEEEKEKMCDKINSASFLAYLNSEIGKIKELADGKVTMISNSEPVLQLQTGK